MLEAPHQAPATLPQAGAGIDDRTSRAGLRTVASFEASKGLLVLALGITLLALHSHVQDLAESLLYHLHIDFDRRLGHAVLNAASTINDARWWAIGAAVGSYSSVRFIEAWGLWHRRVWAEWFALLSGAMYLPWEFLKMAEKTDWDRIAVFGINVVIVSYMAYIRLSEVRAQRRSVRIAGAPKSSQPEETLRGV